MSRKYSVKEIYYTIQGEGANTGRPAVFVRFSGCNLWSGKEEDRHKAICKFCDTDFVGVDGVNGGKFSDAKQLADKALKVAPNQNARDLLLVCTGGEPLLQLDEELIHEFKKRGFIVAVETNGTLPAPKNLDWVCVSPKAGADFVQKTGDELKIVYPQKGINPKNFEDLKFKHFFLQPMDNENIKQNIKQAIEYCLRNPKWRLSLQTHKIIGIP